MSINKIYPWHAIYKLDKDEIDKLNWNFDEFERVSFLMKKFSSELSSRSSDLNHNHNDNNNNTIYEINIQNKYREDKQIDSYWWVKINNTKEWWPSKSTILLFKKYGWMISFE